MNTISNSSDSSDQFGIGQEGRLENHAKKASQNPGNAWRGLFPFFSASRDLSDLNSEISSAYLDSAATTQKPLQVINSLVDFLSHRNSNVHRGAYALSSAATDDFEAVRDLAKEFFHADGSYDVVFTSGATAGFNLLAFGLSALLKPEDFVLVSVLEHHSNIVPWQLGVARGAYKLAFIDITNEAQLTKDNFAKALRDYAPKVVSFTALSNAFGTEPELLELIGMAKAVGAIVILDAAQAAAHRELDLAKLQPDAIVCSGHKIYGPTGVGMLIAKHNLLNQLPPYQGGGEMIEQVTIEGSTYRESPARFEAGTPPIAEVIGLGEALKFLQQIGHAAALQYERQLFEYGWERLSQINKVELLGPRRAGGAQSTIIPFNVQGVHPHDVATIADTVGVQIRSGHHCAMPALRRLGLRSSARASIALYTSQEDLDRLAESLKEVVKRLG